MTTTAQRRIGRTKVRMARLSVDVPAALHKRLRMRALEDNQTMTDRVIALIEHDLGLAEGKKESKK